MARRREQPRELTLLALLVVAICVAMVPLYFLKQRAAYDVLESRAEVPLSAYLDGGFDELLVEYVDDVDKADDTQQQPDPDVQNPSSSSNDDDESTSEYADPALYDVIP